MSEPNSLIMNENHVAPPNALLPAEDTLAGIMPQTQQQKVSQLHYGNQMEQHFKNLRKLDPRVMSFKKYDTVQLKMMVDGEIKPLNLNIRSVPDEITQKLDAKHQEVVNATPKAINPSTGAQMHDIHHPLYKECQQQMVDSFNHKKYMTVLHGLLEEILDLDGNTVWHPFDTSMQFPEQALKVLINVMGIAEGERDGILDAIEELSEVATREQRENIEKK